MKLLADIHERNAILASDSAAVVFECRSAWKIGSSATSVQVVVMRHGPGAP